MKKSTHNQPSSSTSTLLGTEQNLREQFKRANDRAEATSSPFIENFQPNALRPVNLICPQVRYQKNGSNLSQSNALRREGSTSSIGAGSEDLHHLLAETTGKRSSGARYSLGMGNK